MKSRAIAFLLFAILLSGAALAQEPTVISGQVTSATDGSPLPGATVIAPALGLTATTDAEGRYTLTVPPGSGLTVELQVTLPEHAPSTAEVDLAPGAVTQDFSLGVGFYESITVGSRAGGAEAEKSVPVDVFQIEDIETAGASETNQILEALTPSFNFPRPTITDGTDTVRPATLRGLGSDQVLVLINGKRRHTSALVHVNGSIGRGSSGVDLNAIPASAIENIEILRDGAAAQYGSDAIAGVINLVLKSDPQPLRIDAKVGSTTHSDGEMLDTSVNGGWPIGRGVLFFTGEYRVRYETNR